MPFTSWAELLQTPLKFASVGSQVGQCSRLSVGRNLTGADLEKPLVAGGIYSPAQRQGLPWALRAAGAALGKSQIMGALP